MPPARNKSATNETSSARPHATSSAKARSSQIRRRDRRGATGAAEESLRSCVTRIVAGNEEFFCDANPSRSRQTIRSEWRLEECHSVVGSELHSFAPTALFAHGKIRRTRAPRRVSPLRGLEQARGSQTTPSGFKTTPAHDRFLISQTSATALPRPLSPRPGSRYQVSVRCPSRV